MMNAEKNAELLIWDLIRTGFVNIFELLTLKEFIIFILIVAGIVNLLAWGVLVLIGVI